MREYNWNYERDPVSISVYVKRISEEITGICQTLRDLEGDMYVSDLRKLYDMEWKLSNLVQQIKKEKEESKE